MPPGTAPRTLSRTLHAPVRTPGHAEQHLEEEAAAARAGPGPQRAPLLRLVDRGDGAGLADPPVQDGQGSGRGILAEPGGQFRDGVQRGGGVPRRAAALPAGGPVAAYFWAGSGGGHLRAGSSGR